MAASVGMGFFKRVRKKRWTAFSAHRRDRTLSDSCLGLISVLRGVKGGLRGENYAMVGTLLCATSLGIGLTLNQFLRYLQWESLPVYPW